MQEATPKPLRLMIYDDTCRGVSLLPGLTHSWWLGGHLYRMLGRIDACRGVSTWDEGLEWLAQFEAPRAIAEIQFWGHGNWGNAYVDRAPLDVEALQPEHPWRRWLAQIRDRLTGPEALWWFRTCETFGAAPGQRFAVEFTRFMGCKAAGHTFIIGPWQSGLHSLRPGETPHWPVDEGLAEGSPERPTRALWSRPGRPHTITCLTGAIPKTSEQ